MMIKLLKPYHYECTTTMNLSHDYLIIDTRAEIYYSHDH